MLRFILVFFHFFLVFISVCTASSGEVVIVCNSPEFDIESIKRYTPGRYVIALDGAADRLQKNKMLPHAILGDFDSIENLEFWGINSKYSNLNSYAGKNGVTIVPRNNQNYSDLTKAVQYCDEKGFKTIYIVNALGGRLDHTLANIRFLRMHYKPDRKIWIINKLHHIEFVKDGQTTIQGSIGQSCAIMAAPHAFVTSHGLAYEMDNFELEFGISESCCNLLKIEKAEITIQGEAIVIHPTRPYGL